MIDDGAILKEILQIKKEVLKVEKMVDHLDKDYEIYERKAKKRKKKR